MVERKDGYEPPDVDIVIVMGIGTDASRSWSAGAGLGLPLPLCSLALRNRFSSEYFPPSLRGPAPAAPSASVCVWTDSGAAPGPCAAPVPAERGRRAPRPDVVRRTKGEAGSSKRWGRDGRRPLPVGGTPSGVWFSLVLVGEDE